MLRRHEFYFFVGLGGGVLWIGWLGALKCEGFRRQRLLCCAMLCCVLACAVLCRVLCSAQVRCITDRGREEEEELSVVTRVGGLAKKALPPARGKLKGHRHAAAGKAPSMEILEAFVCSSLG